MTGLIETMETMAKAASVLGKFPGLDKERVNNYGADKMRKTMSENLAKVVDDATQAEVYRDIKEVEDEMIQDSDVDTDGIAEGQVRMHCQMAIIERLIEGAQ